MVPGKTHDALEVLISSHLLKSSSAAARLLSAIAFEP